MNNKSIESKVYKIIFDFLGYQIDETCTNNHIDLSQELHDSIMFVEFIIALEDGLGIVIPDDVILDRDAFTSLENLLHTLNEILCDHCD